MEQTIKLFKSYFGRPGLPGPVVDTSRSDAASESDSGDISTIYLRTGHIVAALVVSMLMLLVANFAVLVADHLTNYSSVVISKLIKAVSVDEELNVPSYFGTLILVVSSALLALISFLKITRREPYAFHWTVLAAGFLFMSFDEMASVHEKLIGPMRTLMGGENLGVFHFGWVVPAILLVFMLAVGFLRFWWNLPKRTRTLTFIAGTFYLGGAVGMELVGGKYADLYGNEGLLYKTIASVEETFEMIGVIVFIKALLEYISINYRGLRIGFFSSDRKLTA